MSRLLINRVPGRWGLAALGVFLLSCAGNPSWGRLPAAAVLGALFALCCAAADCALRRPARTRAWRGPARAAFVLAMAFACPGFVLGILVPDAEQIVTTALVALAALALLPAPPPAPAAARRPS